MQIDFLVLDGPPQPFDEDVVPEPPSTVHADCNLLINENAGERLGGELASLVRVEDLGRADPQGIFECLDAESAVEGVGQLPGDNETAEPIHDRDEEDEAALHGDVGNVCAPGLIGTLDGHVAQQVGILAMLRLTLRGLRTCIDCPDPHPVHYATDTLAVDDDTLTAQLCRHASGAVEGPPYRDLIDLPHDVHRLGGHRAWLVIDA